MNCIDVTGTVKGGAGVWQLPISSGDNTPYVYKPPTTVRSGPPLPMEFQGRKFVRVVRVTRNVQVYWYAGN